MNKTEEALVGLMTEEKVVNPEGKRQWAAFDKITDSLHSTGNFGPLVGFIIPTSAGGYYRFIPLSAAREVFAEHYSGKPGSRCIRTRS